MQLHFRGIQVPALGSPRDIVYRNYLIHETKLEAKKHQLSLMTALGSANINSESRSEWNRQATQVFDEYVSLMFGEEITPARKEETEMLRYYEEKIKKSKPIMMGDSSKGNLTVTNLPKF